MKFQWTQAKQSPLQLSDSFLANVGITHSITASFTIYEQSNSFECVVRLLAKLELQ